MGLSDSLLSMWVVYERPADMPELFVARRHEVGKGEPHPTDDVLTGRTLQEVRDALPFGLYCMPRDDADEPHIVEVWL